MEYFENLMEFFVSTIDKDVTENINEFMRKSLERGGNEKIPKTKAEMKSRNFQSIRSIVTEAVLSDLVPLNSWNQDLLLSVREMNCHLGTLGCTGWSICPCIVEG